MSTVHFPTPFRHDHPPVRNVNESFDEKLTVGQKTADGIAVVVGSWFFIIGQSALLVVWVVLNILAVKWDPYPFILLNLMLSLQAAYTAPILMMSQNRLAARDRLEAHHDFEINLKAEQEVAAVLAHLEAQDRALTQIHGLLAKLVENPRSSETR